MSKETIKGRLANLIGKDSGVSSNSRREYLKNPRIRPEKFGNDPYLANLGAIERIIVGHGKADHSGNYLEWELSTGRRDDEKDRNYYGSVRAHKCRWRWAEILVYRLGNASTTGLSVSLESPGGKIGITASFDTYPDARNFEKVTAENPPYSFNKTPDKSAIIRGRGVYIRSPIRSLSPQTADFLNSITADMVSKFQAYLTDSKRKEEPEIITDLPKNTDDRAVILRQLKNIVKIDKSRRYYKDRRHPDEYVRDLEGVEATFNYLRSLEVSNRVVDVGAGFGEATKAIADKYGEGLEMYATNLTVNDNLIKNLGRDKVRITPAEFMKGFETQSVAGIIAVASIAYSVAPNMVVCRLDEILVPGGIIKASFRSPDKGGMMEYGFQTHHEFTRYLEQLGYDVAVADNFVVLAIKPGGPLNVEAKTLLTKDKQAYKRSGLNRVWRVNTSDGGVIYHEDHRK